MFGRKSLLAEILFVACVFMGCTKEYTQTVNLTGDGYVAQLDGVLISMSPTTVTKGKEVTIDISHGLDKKVEVEIKSTSLSYHKTVKTPATVKIKMEAEGVHDISFIQKRFGISMTCDAIIVCK